MSNNNSQAAQPQQPLYSRRRLKPALLAGIIVGSLIVGLAIVFGLRAFFASEAEPKIEDLQACVAEKLDARYGKLYSVAAFQAGEPLDRPLIVTASDKSVSGASSVSSQSASPVSTLSTPSISFSISATSSSGASSRPVSTQATTNTHNDNPISPISPISSDSPVSPFDSDSSNGAPVSPVAPASAASRVSSYGAVDGRLHYVASMTARLNEPLYVPVAASGFIENEMKLDTSATRKIEQILSAPGADRIREIAGIDTNTDSLASMRLIREIARTGTRVEFRVLITAERANDGWRIEVTSLDPKSPPPEGEVLGKFNGRLLDVTRESDLATLRRLVAQGDETLQRVELARDRYRAELAANASRAVTTFLTQLTPGSLFVGKVVLPGQTASPDLSLEIVSLDRANASVTALLRADSSWSDSRSLEGRYNYDTSNGVFGLSLSAHEGVPLASAANVLINDGKPFKMNLRLAGDQLSGEAVTWSCALARVPEAKRASTIAAFNVAGQKLLDATRPGTFYRVRTSANLTAATAASSVPSGDIVLRFKAQDASTGALTASLENISGSWSRELQGVVITNTYRANGYPLRLLSVLDPSRTGASDTLPIGISVRFMDDQSFTGSIRTRDTVAVTLEPADAALIAQINARPKPLPAVTTVSSTPPQITINTAINTANGSSPSTATATNAPSNPSDIFSIALPANSSATPASGTTGSVITVPSSTLMSGMLKPTDRLPPANGAYVWEEGVWWPLPFNNGRVVRSTLQKVGGVWSSAVSLIKSRPDKQDTGTLTFDGNDKPPAVSGTNIVLVFRGTFKAYAGVPSGETPIEVAPLELKSKSRKRVVDVDRLGDAASTFGKAREPITIEQSEPNVYVVRINRTLSPGRYTLNAPDHPFEFEVRQ